MLFLSLSKDLDEEPMALREETALENEVAYDGSLGRASLNRPIQPLHAPTTVSFSHLLVWLSICSIELFVARQTMNEKKRKKKPSPTRSSIW